MAVVGWTVIFVTGAPERRSMVIVRVPALTTPTMPATSSLFPVAVTTAGAVAAPVAGVALPPALADGAAVVVRAPAVGVALLELPLQPVSAATATTAMRARARRIVGQGIAR